MFDLYYYNELIYKIIEIYLSFYFLKTDLSYGT